jgi:hypothetical protein
MGIFSYLIHGVDLASNTYNRLSPVYPLDEIRPIAASHDYQGIVTSEETLDTTSKRVLDFAIEIISVSDEPRTLMIKFWKTRSAQCLGLGIGGMGLAVAGFVGAVVAGIMLSGTLGLAVGVSLSLVAAAIASIVLSILGFHRMDQADKQRQAWQDPLPAYQAQRQKTQTEGFSHVFYENLKGTLIHSEECQQLWVDWSNQEMGLYQQIQLDQSHSPDVLGKINRFFSHNPLDSDVMDYVFEENRQPPKHIQDLRKTYQQIKASYSNIRSATQNKKSLFYQEKERLLSENETKREASLAPALLFKNQTLAETSHQHTEEIREIQNTLQQTLDQINQRFPYGRVSCEELVEKRKQIAEAEKAYENNPIVLDANRNYHIKCHEAKLTYDAVAKPINLKFDNLKREIEERAADQIQKVNEGEDGQVSHFAKDVQGLAEAFVDEKVYIPSQT